MFFGLFFNCIILLHPNIIIIAYSSEGRQSSSLLNADSVEIAEFNTAAVCVFDSCHKEGSFQDEATKK